MFKIKEKVFIYSFIHFLFSIIIKQFNTKIIILKRSRKGRMYGFKAHHFCFEAEFMSRNHKSPKTWVCERGQLPIKEHIAYLPL